MGKLEWRDRESGSVDRAGFGYDPVFHSPRGNQNGGGDDGPVKKMQFLTALKL
jgi:inosine/xanthosine triphosphate pyrophosphatase family protein